MLIYKSFSLHLNVLKALVNTIQRINFKRIC